MVPLITFPMGAGFEAYSAYNVMMSLQFHENQVPAVRYYTQALYGALGLVVLVNVIGGIVWYPSMVKKVLKRLKPSPVDAKKLQ